jgi:hypothetical protein
LRYLVAQKLRRPHPKLNFGPPKAKLFIVIHTLFFTTPTNHAYVLAIALAPFATAALLNFFTPTRTLGGRVGVRFPPCGRPPNSPVCLTFSATTAAGKESIS